MFRAKTPKYEKFSKEAIDIIDPLGHKPYLSNLTYYRVVSIDPGVVNFGLRIEDCYLDGRRVMHVFERFCFKDSVDPQGDLLAQLDNLDYLLKTSHLIAIEKQLPHKQQSLLMMQHTITYFRIKLLSWAHSRIKGPIILLLDSKFKYKALAAPAELSDSAKKKWGQDYAIQLFHLWDDQRSLAKILSERGVRGQKKMDDLADATLQIVAVCANLPQILAA